MHRKEKHLDPPNYPLYPLNISWISTKRLLDIHDICFPYLFLPPVHFKMCLIHTVLYYFYASEDPHCASIRRRGPRDADGMVTIILAFGEDTLASREDIRAPLGMGGLS